MIITKKEYEKAVSIMEYSSFDSDPILRLFGQLCYLSKLAKYPFFTHLFDSIDHILVKFHFLLFDTWIRKKIRQYYHLLIQCNGTITFMRGVFTNNTNKMEFTPEYRYIQKELGTFMTHCFIESIGKEVDTNEKESVD